MDRFSLSRFPFLAVGFVREVGNVVVARLFPMGDRQRLPVVLTLKIRFDMRERPTLGRDHSIASTDSIVGDGTVLQWRLLQREIRLSAQREHPRAHRVA